VFGLSYLDIYSCCGFKNSCSFFSRHFFHFFFLFLRCKMLRFRWGSSSYSFSIARHLSIGECPRSPPFLDSFYRFQFFEDVYFTSFHWRRGIRSLPPPISAYIFLLHTFSTRTIEVLFPSLMFSGSGRRLTKDVLLCDTSFPSKFSLYKHYLTYGRSPSLRVFAGPRLFPSCAYATSGDFPFCPCFV